MADWVERQIAAHPGNHFVVTSRSYGLPGPLTAQADVLRGPAVYAQIRFGSSSTAGTWPPNGTRPAPPAGPHGAPCGYGPRESAARLTSLLRAASGTA